MQQQNINTVLESILGVFQGFRMPALPTDQYEAVGRAKLAEKMMPFVSEGKPIEFVMLGFHMKSMNDRDKVLGKMPDLGEEIAFRNFGRFSDKIKEVYSPGIQMNIVNDGYAFNDLMEISDHTVRSYEEICLDMASGTPTRIYDMTHFYNSGLRLSEMREKLEKQFGITDTELEKRILLDPDVNTLYRGMIKFMMGDLAIKNFTSGNQLQKAAKKMARMMMLRNEAYSGLVRSEFSSFVRLSMHPSINNGIKYSFQLIPSPKAWTSPWHCAIAVDDNGEVETIHRKDAEEAGYELIYRDGRPWNFRSHL